jgi:hypothetical protein
MKLTSQRLLIAVTLIVSATLLTTIVWRSAWNYAGYCRSQQRFLSADEKIGIAIDDVLQTYPPPVRIPPGSQSMARPARPIPYSSAREFTARNPDCCAIVQQLPGGYAPSVTARILGKFASFVRLEFRVRYFAVGGEEEQLVEKHVAISNCGRPWSGF